MAFRRVGIIGLGTVGGALEAWFASQDVELYRYDTLKHVGSVDEVNIAEVVFICVPTPFVPERGFDVSYVEAAVGALVAPKVVVIKSTVVPGTTERLQATYSQHLFLMNPEFLREATAREDMLQPDRQLVGYTAPSRAVAEDVLSLLPPAPYARLVPATVAELIKYFTNTFLATKVTLANEFYDLAQHFGVDYKSVAEGLAADARIGGSHLTVDPKSRGYGGKCLPKDVAALAQLTRELGLTGYLIQAVDEHNNKYRQ